MLKCNAPRHPGMKERQLGAATCQDVHWEGCPWVHTSQPPRGHTMELSRAPRGWHPLLGSIVSAYRKRLRQRGQHGLAREERPGHCERSWKVPQHARPGHTAGLGLTVGCGAGWENPWGVLHHTRMDQSSPTLSPHLSLDGGHPTASLGAVPTYQSQPFLPSSFGAGPQLQVKRGGGPCGPPLAVMPPLSSVWVSTAWISPRTAKSVP